MQAVHKGSISSNLDCLGKCIAYAVERKKGNPPHPPPHTPPRDEPLAVISYVINGIARPKEAVSFLQI